MSAEAVIAASMAFNRALIERGWVRSYRITWVVRRVPSCIPQLSSPFHRVTFPSRLALLPSSTAIASEQASELRLAPMTSETVLTIGSQALQLVLMLAAPLLLTALTVGVVIGVFQAATQINEQTLSFIPKLAACAAVIVIAGPWMLGLLVEYTKRLFESIPSLLH